MSGALLRLCVSVCGPQTPISACEHFGLPCTKEDQVWFPVWACGHVDCEGRVTASPNMAPRTTASGKLLFLLTLPCARVIRLQFHQWMCVYVLHSTDFGPSLHFLKLPCARLRFQGCALCMRGGILKRWIHFMQYLLKTKDNGNSF